MKNVHDKDDDDDSNDGDIVRNSVNLGDRLQCSLYNSVTSTVTQPLNGICMHGIIGTG